jgi:D-galactarolactone cycloisomerase
LTLRIIRVIRGRILDWNHAALTRFIDPRNKIMSGPVASRRSFLQQGAWGAALAAAASGPAASALAQDKPSSLTITSVETFALQHRLKKAIGPSTILYPFRDALIIKITTDSGLVGWGETADVGGTRGIIENHLKGVLLGKNPLEHRKLWRELWGPNFGDGRAVGGVDIAIQDLRGKALGLSIADLYGGRVRDKAFAYASSMNYTEGIDPEDQFPEEAARLVARGFRALKARTGRFTPKRDLAVLAKVRDAVGPDIRLQTDGNGGLTFAQAVPFAKELERLGFYFFEEPLPQRAPQYPGYKELAAAIDIPLAGGEGLDSRLNAKDLMTQHAFDIIQPDATLCGGIGECLAVAELAALFGILCHPHCWGGALAIAATMQVIACIPNFTWGHSSDQPMLELDVYENPFRDELTSFEFKVTDGYITLPTGPGLGIEIDEDVIRKYLKEPRTE